MCAMLALGSTVSAEAAPLRASWPQQAAPADFNGQSTKCESLGEPVVQLKTKSRYSKDDPSRTVIDEDRSEAYEKKIAPVRAFAIGVVKGANDYVASGGKDQASAYCAGQNLYTWAAADALAKAKSEVANFNTATFLAAVSSAYGQIQESRTIAPEQRQVIEAWLLRLSDSTREFYQPKRESKSLLPNNIQYWAALAVANTAVVLQREEDFDWAVEGLRRGVCSANADGSLPREIERKGRALHYHLFALQPLTALAELAEVNGRGGYEFCQGALHRIIDFTLKAVDNPGLIEAEAGESQIQIPPLKPGEGDYAWLEIYASRFKDFAWASKLPKLRPFLNTNLGGNLSALYGKAPKAL